MESQVFTIPASAFDVSLLPAGARTLGTTDFREAVVAFFVRAFVGFGGEAKVVVTNEQVTVSWNSDPSKQKPLQLIIEKLQRGETSEGIQLLRLLLAKNPDDVDLLYNLALALSGDGRIEEAEKHLRTVVDLAPSFINGLAALGTVLTRQQKNDEAEMFLASAVRLDPTNGWVLRNLAVVLMKQGRHDEAAARFREAVTLNLSDQGSWLGLGDSLRILGNRKNAEEAYRHAIALNPHNETAEAAEAGLGELASTVFREKAVGEPQPDAVQYCADAIQTFRGMQQDELKKIAMEIVTEGRSGFDVNTPTKQYQLKTLPGEFSGLEMVCYLYVVMQMIAPGTDIGFDLRKEYDKARSVRR